MTKGKREPRSPYARYGKTPYRYSDIYREWHELVKKSGTNDSERARELEARHRQAMDLPPRETFDHIGSDF